MNTTPAKPHSLRPTVTATMRALIPSPLDMLRHVNAWTVGEFVDVVLPDGRPSWGVVLDLGDRPGTMFVDHEDRGVEAFAVRTVDGRVVS